MCDAEQQASPDEASSAAQQTRSLTMDLLISEKEHADQRIGAYFEIQAKIIGIAFPAVLAAIGWIFIGNNGNPLEATSTAVLCLLICIVSSISLLVGTVFNGFALAYIGYKKDHLGPRMQALLALEENPLAALATAKESPARRPIMFATLVLGISQSLTTLGVLLYAARLVCMPDIASSGHAMGLLVAGFTTIGATISQGLFLLALKNVTTKNEQ